MSVDMRVPSDQENEVVSACAERLFLSIRDVSPTILAMAALKLAVSLWQIGGVTKEQARTTCEVWIDAIITGRSS